MPVPDEPVQPYHVLNGVRLVLDEAQPPVKAPLTWTWRFPGEPYSIRFAGAAWQLSAGDDPTADVYIETTPRIWAGFVMTPQAGRRLPSGIHLIGSESRMGEFRAVFGLAAHGRDRVLDHTATTATQEQSSVRRGRVRRPVSEP
jgi:hypothetical protein